MTALTPPHGGALVNLLVDDARALELKTAATEWPSWDLTARQLCDLELLLDGGFSPLRGFMTEAQYRGACADMRLPDGTLWPMPITLDVDDDTAGRLEAGATLALRDPEGVMLAVLHVDDVYRPDHAAEAEQVFGTTDPAHPGVAHLLRSTNAWYVGGTVEGVERPTHYDFTERRLTPAQTRDRFAARGWDRVVAFQTRNPMHRAHQELTLRAARDAEAALLIHPVVGMTKPGDVDHYTRVRCYEALLAQYPEHTAELSLLPLAMRMGGPREALWHAIIRKNFGCTHLIVGRDHAGPGSNAAGEPFYGPYDAQEMLQAHTDELGIAMVPFRLMVYLPAEARYAPIDEVPEGAETASISGTELRQRLADGADLPEWFTFPAVAAELRRTHPPRSRQGVTVFFTGLSGSGKSTIANVLQSKLLELGGRAITMLDGDLVRKHLSSELGFSKDHRDLNIRRIGFVAGEVTRHGGAAVCAPIAPYAHTRQEVRDMVEAGGGFVLVHVSTPLEVCEQRDRKGLYAKARAGIIPEFTGISDPYEEPTDAELTVDASTCTPEQAADRIVGYLQGEGYLAK